MKNLFLLFLILLLPNLSYSGATGDVLKDTAKGAVVGGAVSAVQTKVGQEVLGKEMSEKLGNFFDSPPGILLVSGMATVYSGVLFNAAAKQETDAGDNIKKIDRIMAEFKDSYIYFCPNGRDDLKSPECYCYLPKGGQNPDRTKSQTCQDFWKKDNYKLSAVAGNYNGVSGFVDPVGCLTLNGQFDENCRCKKFVDSKGSNACMKSVSVSMPSGMASAMVNGTGLKDIMQLAANSSNGNPMLNNFSTGAMGLKAIAASNLKNQLIQKLSSANGGTKNNSGFSMLNEKNVGQLAKSLIGEKNIAAAVARSTSAIDVGASGPTDPKVAALLKATAAKAGLSLVGSGHGLSNKKVNGKEAMNFNFMGETANAGASQTQNFPEKEKNYKIQDISKRPDTSIFEIISNRYIQSGLKRLFDN